MALEVLERKKKENEVAEVEARVGNQQPKTPAPMIRMESGGGDCGWARWLAVVLEGVGGMMMHLSDGRDDRV